MRPDEIYDESTPEQLRHRRIKEAFARLQLAIQKNKELTLALALKIKNDEDHKN